MAGYAAGGCAAIAQCSKTRAEDVGKAIKPFAAVASIRAAVRHQGLRIGCTRRLLPLVLRPWFGRKRARVVRGADFLVS